MGAGNYLPQYGDDVPYYHINIDMPWNDGMDEDDQQFQYQDMLRGIRAVLPDSFWDDERWFHRGSHQAEHRRWRNGLFEVRFVSWNNSEVIIVKVADDAPPFVGDNKRTWEQLRKLSSAIFDAAARHGHAWWRRCAWTGCPYTPGELLAPSPTLPVAA